MYPPTIRTCLGQPDYGYYSALDYPDAGYGFDFGPGIYLAASSAFRWGGWGWGPNWFNCSIFENGYFFNHYGFRNFDGRGVGGHGTWTHNPEHRLGVSYPNQGLANRFGGNLGNRGNLAQAQHNVAANWQASRFLLSELPPMPDQASGIAPEVRAFNRITEPDLPMAGTVFGATGIAPHLLYSPANGGFRAMPAYRSSPSFGGGVFAPRLPLELGAAGAVDSIAFDARHGPGFSRRAVSPKWIRLSSKLSGADR